MANNTVKRYDKAKLLKLVKESKPGPYEPTLGEVLFWYDTLNELIFKKELQPLTGIYMRKTQCWAETYCHRYKNQKMITEIKMSNNFNSFKGFLEILAHEMIHIWEFNNFSVMGHGERFFSWAPELKKYGLDLAVMI